MVPFQLSFGTPNQNAYELILINTNENLWKPYFYSYEEDIFEGQGEILTNNNQKFHHSSESKLTVAAVSDSTIKKIFSLLEEMKEEHDMKKRLELHVQL